MEKDYIISELQLQWTAHETEDFPAGKFANFIISGKPLQVLLGINIHAMVSSIGFFKENGNNLPGNRFFLYNCDCCGDIGCGAVTAKFLDKGSVVQWADFAWQSGEDEPGTSIKMPALTFERNQYFSVLGKNKLF